MSHNASITICCVANFALCGFVFWLTRSKWAFLLGLPIVLGCYLTDAEMKRRDNR